MYNYVKKCLYLACLSLALLLLGGCSLKFGDSLLLLPKVPTEYVQLQQQLNTILQQGAVYAVADSGMNRQAVQLVDLDGAGDEEALAFFRTETGAYQVYAFRKEGEHYTRIGMAEGYGNSLRAIYYPTLGDGRLGLAMCWGFDEGGSYGMTVYNFGDSGMTVLMDIQYADVAIEDIDGDGAQEMAFAVRDSVTGLYSARVCQFRDDQYRVLYEVPMCLEVRSVASMRFGKVDRNQVGLYIDSVATTGGYVTDLIWYDGRMAANRTIDQASGSGAKTWRPTSVFCTDVSGDGRVDVPVSHTFSYEPNETELRSRLDWVNYDELGAETLVSSTLHRASENWYLVWPESWGEQVRLDSVSTVSLSQTVCWTPGPEGQRQRLLTVYLFTGDSRENDAALYRKLQPLASNAYGLYRCDLHESDPASLTLEQVRSLFHTVEVSWNSEEY
ncbi:MAG: hypothetical protein IJA84_05465 [Clostridia bacterium]|nr:hypothetical protein [Clostridia bacterium]